jgi:hypothetical protein
MYKNKYIKYKAKYTQLCNKIHIGGEFTSFDKNLISYLKKEVEIFKKVSQKNISQDVWSIIRLQTIMNNLYHPIPLQIKNNFFDKWIKQISSDREKIFLDKKRILEFLVKNTDLLITTYKKNESKITNEIIDCLSYINFFSNKTYFSIGSFIHVVGIMFYYAEESDEDKIMFLTENQLVHSMIENLANFIYKFDRKTNIVKSIIYFERFINAYKLLKDKQGVPLNQDSDEIFQHMDEMKSILNASNKSLIKQFDVENFKQSLEIISPKKYILRTCDLNFYLSTMIQLLMSVINDNNSYIKITFVDGKFLFTLDI